MQSLSYYVLSYQSFLTPSNLIPSLSRDEVNHLMEILHSRAVEHPTVDCENRNQTIRTAEKGKGVVITDDFPKTSSEEKQEDLNKAIWGTSTPLPQSAVSVAVNLLCL